MLVALYGCKLRFKLTKGIHIHWHFIMSGFEVLIESAVDLPLMMILDIVPHYCLDISP